MSAIDICLLSQFTFLRNALVIGITLACIGIILIVLGVYDLTRRKEKENG